METLADKRELYIKWGLIYAGAAISYQLIAYIAGIDFYASIANFVLLFAVGIGMQVLVALQLRKAAGEFIEFKTLFLDMFFVLAAALLLSTLFDFVLNTVIDPDLPVKVIDKSAEKTMAWMEGKVPEGELDKTFNEFEKAKVEAKDKYTIGGIVMNYFSALAIWMIPALIIALIFKKQPTSPFNDNAA